MPSKANIPVTCGGETHYLAIDPLLLEAFPVNHPAMLERYESLALLGGEPPACYYMCQAFNELSASFKDKPDKFWAFVTQLTDFAWQGKRDIL